MCRYSLLVCIMIHHEVLISIIFVPETYRNYTEGIFYDAMDFWPDEEHGIAFGDPIDGRMTIIKTDDGGDTWHDIPFEERPEVPEGVHAFAASGTCLRTHVSVSI